MAAVVPSCDDISADQEAEKGEWWCLLGFLIVPFDSSQDPVYGIVPFTLPEYCPLSYASCMSAEEHLLGKLTSSSLVALTPPDYMLTSLHVTSGL